jgi:hypothetical protein
VTLQTWLATEDISAKLGNTLLNLEMLKKNASPTNLELDQYQLAQRNAIQDHLSTGLTISITAKRLSTLDALLTSRLSSITMDLLRLDSWFTKISCHTNQEFTNTPQEDSLEDTPSKSLDGE